MLIETLSVFPELFEPYMSTSIMGRARSRGLFDFKSYDLRDWTHDRHRTVDDAPFGGGAGMLMKVEPLHDAITDISSRGDVRPCVVFFTPCGVPFTQHVAERLSSVERILFVCGRYEGMDERAYALADERLSIGDYVLTGGELPALVVSDAIIRLLPGASAMTWEASMNHFPPAKMAAFSSMPSTRVPPTSTITPCPRCCFQATMPRLMPGAAQAPSSARAGGVPT